jgi:DNA-binding SARP family transcriptional activator
MIAPAPTVTIRLFGGVELERAGIPLSGRATQRRRLALLALLATASGRFLSRDRALGLLWPEADTESGRHQLANAVYELRRALGEEAILSRGDDLGLNPALASIDVTEFDAACEEGDWERAAELSRGPLLDGFFVAEAPEFDRWLENTRRRYRLRQREALERVAARRLDAGDHRAAAEAWVRLVMEEPTDPRLVAGAMRALDLAGNRAEALRHARAYQARVREELEAEPAAEVLRLAETLERRAMAEPALPAPVPPVASSAPATRPARPRRRALLIGAGALAGVALMAVARGAGPGAAPARRLERVARQSTSAMEAATWFGAGERAHRAGRHLEAVDHYRRAVALDSGLALGWYRLSQSILAADLPEPTAILADSAASRHAAPLPDRERLLLRAWLDFRSGNAESAEERYRSLVSLYPDDLEAWLQLGETLFHYNPLRGRPIAEAVAPFKAALRLEPANRDALWHLAQLHAHAGEPQRFAELTERLLRLGPEPARELELRTLRAIALRDQAQLHRLEPQLRQTDELRLYQLYWRSAVFLRDLGAAGHIASIMSGTERPLYSRLLGYSGRATMSAVQGRVAEMQALVDTLLSLGLDPGLRQVIAANQAMVLSLLHGTGGSARLVTDPAATLDSLDRAATNAWFGLALTNAQSARLEPRFLRAESLFRLGRHHQALGWYASFAEHSPTDLLYLPRALLRQAESQERLGRPADAAAAYRRLLGLWRGADPEFDPLLDSIRTRIAGLGG